MHDTLFHPFSALRCYRDYRQLKEELARLVGRDFPGDGREEAVQEAFAGKINFPDAFILRRLLRRYRPGKILEVGSFVGFSTRWILDSTAAWNAHVVSVDPNIRHRSFDRPGDQLRALNAVHLPHRLEVIEGFFGTAGDVYHDYLHREPRRDRAFVDQLVGQRQRIGQDWPRVFDFIFIDGDHSYEAARQNFDIALRLLCPGGVLAFHDALSWEGVNRALTEIQSEYRGKAEVKILGGVDHRVFGGIFRKSTDGIGVFRREAG